MNQKSVKLLYDNIYLKKKIQIDLSIEKQKEVVKSTEYHFLNQYQDLVDDLNVKMKAYGIKLKELTNEVEQQFQKSIIKPEVVP